MLNFLIQLRVFPTSVIEEQVGLMVLQAQRLETPLSEKINCILSLRETSASFTIATLFGITMFLQTFVCSRSIMEEEVFSILFQDLKPLQMETNFLWRNTIFLHSQFAQLLTLITMQRIQWRKSIISWMPFTRFNQMTDLQ